MDAANVYVVPGEMERVFVVTSCVSLLPQVFWKSTGLPGDVVMEPVSVMAWLSL